MRHTTPLTKKSYEKLDACLVSDITDRPRRGYADYSEKTYIEAKALAGQDDWDRAIDRRLQALRKQGQIRCVNKAWLLVETESK
ncbi:MAG: hypothetical protein ACRER5_16180 [Pseudomonas sp.]